MNNIAALAAFAANDNNTAAVARTVREINELRAMLRGLNNEIADARFMHEMHSNPDRAYTARVLADLQRKHAAIVARIPEDWAGYPEA